MNKKIELVKNTLILGFGALFTKLSALLLLPIFTVYLSPSDYGVVDLVLTYVVLLVPVITIQFEMAAFRFLVDVRNDDQQKTRVISNILHTVVVLSVVFSALAIVLHLFVDVPYFWYVLSFVIASVFSSTLLQISRGLGDNKKFAVASVLSGLTVIATVVLLVVFADMGIGGAFIGFIAASIVSGAYLLISLSLWKYISTKMYDVGLQRQLRQYSLPLVPNGVALWVIGASDRTIIVIMIDLAANGVYAVASRIALSLSSLVTILNMSWTESVSLHINAKDRDKFMSETLNSSIAMFASIGLLVVAVSPVLFEYLIGPEFKEGLNYVPILVVAVVFSMVMSLLGAIYVAKKLTKQVAITSTLAAVINVVLAILLIPLFGLYGAAVSALVAYVSIVVFRHFDLKKYVKLQYNTKKFLLISLMYVVVFSVYLIDNLMFTYCVVAASVVMIYIINRSDMKLILVRLLSKKSSKTASQQPDLL